MTDRRRTPSRPFTLRRRALVALSAALLCAGSAQAFAPETEAERDAREAQQVLSDRYTSLWSTLGAAERARFGQAERAWLNQARWAQQRQCIAAAGAVAPSGAADLAARCLTLVTREHAQSLTPPALASR